MKKDDQIAIGIAVVMLVATPFVLRDMKYRSESAPRVGILAAKYDLERQRIATERAIKRAERAEQEVKRLQGENSRKEVKPLLSPTALPVKQNKGGREIDRK